MSSCRDKHVGLEQQLEPSLRQENLETELSLLRQQLATSGIDLSQPDLDKQQLEEQQQLTAAETEIALLEKDIAEEYRQLHILERREKELQHLMSELSKERETLQTDQQQATEHFERLSATVKEVSRQLEELREQLTSATTAVQKGLTGSRFEAEGDYRAALCDDSQRQQWQGDIDKFSAQVQKLSGAHEQLQGSLKDKTQPDLETLQFQLESAVAEKTGAEEVWKRYDSRLGSLVETKKKLARNQQQLDELDKQYAVVGTLSDVANGQTGQKISLQRFVLSVLLDEVLLEASQRFSLMSKGRYQLLRNEDRSKGNKASGLDLLVEDAYTGNTRSVATLSGGESFMAALSLALGLSNVVQAHAGGIHLDTLFIDEGFGSLDPESLDLAIRTLVDLQSSGRMIGLISHVADLKEQIPLRIDVFSNRLGSSTKLSL